MTKKQYQDEEWLRTLYLYQRKSPKEIAKIANVSTSTIRYWIRKFGIQKDVIDLENELAYFAFMMINTTGFYQADTRTKDVQRLKEAKHLYIFYASNLTNKLSEILMKNRVLHLLKEGRENSSPELGKAWVDFLNEHKGKELEGLKDEKFNNNYFV